MTFPRLRSVRAKLLVSSMLPVVVAVLLVAVVSDAFVRTQFRAEMIASLEATASLIAENGSVSLAFEDETDAAAVLASLASRASVVAAALYSAEGVLFVAYPDSASVPARMPAAAENRMGDVTTIREVVLASGELLITLPSGKVPSLLSEVEKKGIDGWEIGMMLAPEEGLISIGHEGEVALPQFTRDELARFFSRPPL